MVVLAAVSCGATSQSEGARHLGIGSERSDMVRPNRCQLNLIEPEHGQDAELGHVPAAVLWRPADLVHVGG